MNSVNSVVYRRWCVIPIMINHAMTMPTARIVIGTNQLTDMAMNAQPQPHDGQVTPFRPLRIPLTLKVGTAAGGCAQAPARTGQCANRA